jgi:hypothetical protein
VDATDRQMNKPVRAAASCRFVSPAKHYDGDKIEHEIGGACRNRETLNVRIPVTHPTGEGSLGDLDVDGTTLKHILNLQVCVDWTNLIICKV